MLIGLGNDVADIKREQEMLASGRLDRFAERVLTSEEYRVYATFPPRRRLEYVTGRFSAKESYAKALGTGIGSHVSFQDIEILNDEQGRPVITKHPLIDQAQAWISISHTTDYVTTVVILEKKEDD
ncbi:holo-ACP synthase [Ligilactobacillus saerimneri]